MGFNFLLKRWVYIYINILCDMSAVNFYKIVCGETKRTYVGSTVLTIEARLNQHERNYRKYLNNRYNFTTSYIIFEKNNYSIQLIDCVECVDKKHRDSIETLHILNENAVNRILPGRERKREDNAVRVVENNEKFECPCGGVYRRTTKSKHRRSKRHVKYENEKEREKENEN